ncbi:MAG: 50S ribosomal protein L23 [Minisyncoccia bacterium]|jgi:large subunit ribosomal protein L23
MALFGNKKVEKKEKKTKKEKTVRVRHARATKLNDGVAHEIIRAPWFSEKALIVTEEGVYTFVVPKRATKAEIAGAIKEIYKVEPRAVRIVNLSGKRKALRMRRGVGQRAARRKAYVYLNKGDTIQFT